MTGYAIGFCPRCEHECRDDDSIVSMGMFYCPNCGFVWIDPRCDVEQMDTDAEVGR